MNMINVEDMEKQETEDIDEITAYREIKKKMSIEPVRIFYKPDDMKLADYKIYEEMLTARLLYKYQGEIIRYVLYVNDSDSSWGEKKEDIAIDEYFVTVNKVEIKVDEFEVPNSPESRKIADFEYKGVHYQLTGVMEKTEFDKILENLYFF